MSKKYELNDVIKLGKNDKKLVSLLIKEGQIFNLIKQGYEFVDDVLEKAGIKKTIRNERIESNNVVAKPKQKETYQKDTESVKNIINSLNTLEDLTNENDVYNQEEKPITLIEDE